MGEKIGGMVQKRCLYFHSQHFHSKEMYCFYEDADVKVVHFTVNLPMMDFNQSHFCHAVLFKCCVCLALMNVHMILLYITILYYNSNKLAYWNFTSPKPKQLHQTYFYLLTG